MMSPPHRAVPVASPPHHVASIHGELFPSKFIDVDTLDCLVYQLT